MCHRKFMYLDSHELKVVIFFYQSFCQERFLLCCGNELPSYKFGDKAGYPAGGNTSESSAVSAN